MSPSVQLYLFWALAGLLTLAAVALVLRPLFKRRPLDPASERQAINLAVYRDQLRELEQDHANGLIPADQYQTARLELEARLAEDVLRDTERAPSARGGRGLGYALGLALPAAAFGLYLWIGNPTAITLAGKAQDTATAGHNLEPMIRAVEARVQANPDDPQPLLLLARTYAALERWQEAANAYARLTQLLPQEASVWADYGEVLAQMQGRDLRGRPMEMVRKALELDPEESTALNLSAIHAFMEGDYASAIRTWMRLMRKFPPDSQEAQDILAAIQEARSRAQAAGVDLSRLEAQPQAAARSGVSIRGRVEISPQLRAMLRPGATLYIIARPQGTAGPPVAVLRASAERLPLDFVLDDSNSMNPGEPLSARTEVSLGARISHSGRPAPEKGDLESRPLMVRLGSQDVRLVIDQVRN